MLRTVVISAGLSLPSYASEAHNHSHDLHTKPSVESVTLKGAFARATLPNQPVGGGFLEIVNNTVSDDRLLAVTTPVARRVEIHEMRMQDDTMKMRALSEGLRIPAGETVTLQPGGYHLMFFDLDEPLVQGESFKAKLYFEKAGAVTVRFEIRSTNAKPVDHAVHGHGS